MELAARQAAERLVAARSSAAGRLQANYRRKGMLHVLRLKRKQLAMEKAMAEEQARKRAEEREAAIRAEADPPPSK